MRNIPKGISRGLTASEQLSEITVVTHDLVAQQYSTYNRSLLPLLKANGLTVVEKHEELTEAQAAYVDDYFEENVYPVLTPMAVDSSRPFPLIRNKSLNIGSLLSKKEKKRSWNSPRSRCRASLREWWRSLRERMETGR